MKKLSELLKEAQSNDNVYVVYFDDGTMFNYYETEEDAKKEMDKLNNEVKSNNCTIKEEPRSNFQTK